MSKQSKQIWLRPIDAFRLWLFFTGNGEKVAIRGLSDKLFSVFGGINSKYYKDWSKKQFKNYKPIK